MELIDYLKLGSQFTFPKSKAMRTAEKMYDRDLRKNLVSNSRKGYIKKARIPNRIRRAKDGVKLNDYLNINLENFDVSFNYEAPTFSSDLDFNDVLSSNRGLDLFKSIGEMLQPETPVINSNLEDSLESLSLQELVDLEKLPIKITSSHRPGATTKLGRTSHHSRKDRFGNSMAYDILPFFNGKVDKSDEGFLKLRNAIMSNKRAVKWFNDHGFGLLDETTAEVMNRTGATGKHFHIGPDLIALRGWRNLLTLYNLA